MSRDPVVRDLVYPPVIWTARAAFRALGLRFCISGSEHVPRSGPVLLAVNHISYVDFLFAGLAALPAGRLVRFMAKKEVFEHRVGGPLMRAMHHVPVDRSDGTASFDRALHLLRSGEVVGVFPEATISRSFQVKQLKTGAVRLAAAAEVPVLPVVLWGTQRIMTKDHPRDLSRGKTIAITVGAPLTTTGRDPVADTLVLRERMGALLDRTIRGYPAEEQPPGSWWLPAAYGGCAPTVEEAVKLDEAERQRRKARRHAG